MIQSNRIYSLFNRMYKDKGISIRGEQRQLRNEKKKEGRQYIITPPKRELKNTITTKYKKFQRQMGYDYPYGTCQILNQMKQNFHEKMIKYLGNQHHVSKRSRMDKVELKKKLEFSPKFNPLSAAFAKVDKIVQKSMRAYAFSRLQN